MKKSKDSQIKADVKKNENKTKKGAGKSKSLEKFVITIGPPKFTRFEKARIIGARSLQLALGAPLFIPIPEEVSDPIKLALREIETNVLPISLRRSLPNGEYQDIPLEYLVSSS